MVRKIFRLALLGVFGLEVAFGQSPGEILELERAKPAVQLLQGEEARTLRLAGFLDPLTAVQQANLNQAVPKDLILDDFESGRPVFLGALNLIAAITSTTDQVRGQSRFEGVTGLGEIVGVWEPGSSPAVKSPEWNDRILFRQSGDETLSNIEHAAHVIGTIAARGDRPEVQGMAYEASIRLYSSADFLEEIQAESAATPQQVAQGKLLVSNHSYG